MGRMERPGQTMEYMEGYLEGEEKLGRLISRWKERPDHVEFRGFVPNGLIEEDDERLRAAEAEIAREQTAPQNRLSLVMEDCLAAAINDHECLGPGCSVERTARADDCLRKTDLVAVFELPDGRKILLAIDVTCTEYVSDVDQKIDYSLRKIYVDGALNEIRYFRSADHPEIGPMHSIPRIVLGLKTSKGKELFQTFVRAQDKDPERRKRANQVIEQGEMASAVKEQALNQLAYQLEFASQKFIDQYIYGSLDLSREEKEKLLELRRILQPITEMKSMSEEVQSMEFQSLLDFLKNPETRDLFESGEEFRNQKGVKSSVVENIYKLLDLVEHLKKVKEDSPKRRNVAGGGVVDTSADLVHAHLSIDLKERARVN